MDYTPSWDVILSPDARDEIAKLSRAQRWYVRSLIDILVSRGTAACPEVRFAIDHPNGSVSILVEIVGPFFVISSVSAGQPRD